MRLFIGLALISLTFNGCGVMLADIVKFSAQNFGKSTMQREIEKQIATPGTFLHAEHNRQAKDQRVY